MPRLFDALTQRGITFRNRVTVSPMCQYSSEDGFATDWHLVHLVSRAVGGAGLVMTEAAAVQPEGRISPQDLGIWQDEHIDKLAQIVELIHRNGAASAIQLAHAGRKASTAVPWEGGGVLSQDRGGWITVAPSALPFYAESQTPKPLSLEDIQSVAEAFVRAAQRSVAANVQVFENRIRFLVEVVQAVRNAIPDSTPLWVRISATDWVENGWDIEQSIALGTILKPMGVDLIDCSSGAIVPGEKIPVGAGYQTTFADRIRRESGIATAAVGMITSPQQAEQIIRTGQADVVSLAREMLRDPYWALNAAKELHQTIPTPVQYKRAW
jgi:2,4-dienoyl-CoA reductase-like NADH-dependent reductase (Old Yellow Enzyme family)